MGEGPIYVVPFCDPYESSISLEDFYGGPTQNTTSFSCRKHRWATVYRGLVQALQGYESFLSNTVNSWPSPTAF